MKVVNKVAKSPAVRLDSLAEGALFEMEGLPGRYFIRGPRTLRTVSRVGGIAWANDLHIAVTSVLSGVHTTERPDLPVREIKHELVVED